MRTLAAAANLFAGLSAVYIAAAEDKLAPLTRPVQIDLNKLPPEVAKRLLQEVAKQKAAAVEAEAPKKKNIEADKENEKEDPVRAREPGKRKGDDKSNK